MKTKLLLLITLFIVTSAFSQWGHRYTTEQPNQNITATTADLFTVSVEWGEGDWTSSSFGYGTTTDGSDWTWTNLDWFEDGTDSNKRCKTDITINTIGDYYYAYRFIKDGNTTYQHGSADWSPNVSTLSAISTITVTLDPALGIENYSKNSVSLNVVNKTIKLNGLNNGEKFEITVYDFSGKKIKSFDQNSSLDLNSISTGLYILNFKSDNNSISKKIIIK
ncbi:T9SS type A sorting domain-containing protein [Lutibacter sp. TH_r2]|uniref:T9SS type A sorting domain-containing protein n=1 Tax=Lutibacter sp. TH_r2 TaxID=3082083 RepID=UPI0029530DF5|nr:T9SS type A sorting domain-containing protein [Lutibacter sp. TH_r2]MDV7188552.1 T9SS type A sorting domain-containing protein [Lutibacter sp. TH_r2]